MEIAEERRGFRISIGTKLATLFLVLAIVPMSATAYYNLTRSQEEVARFAEENLLVLSYSVASEIDQLLIENQRTSATLAGEPLVVQFLSATEEERRELEPEILQTLQNFADTHPDYDAPGLLDANGIVVASLIDELVGRDRSFRDYFIASIQGQPYVSDILVGRATGRPGVFLTNPVITPDGEIVGIDIIWLKGDTIWQIIDGVSVGEEGLAYLVDQDGVIIAHPDRDLLYHSLGTLPPGAVETIAETIRFGTLEDTDTPLIPESLGMDDLAEELMAGLRSGTYRYYSPLDNRYHVVGYTRLQTQPWAVVVDLPEAQFLAPMDKLETLAWISVGLVAVLALAISVLLARGITRPIRKLAQAAVAVENDQPFEPGDISDVTSGHDEIAHLGRVFGDMVVALRRRMEELRTVYEIGQDITAALGVDETLQAILDRVRDVIPYDAAEITLFDRSQNALVVAAWSGGEGIDDTRGKVCGLGKGFAGMIGREKQSVLIEDADKTEIEAVEQLAKDVKARSLLGVPLMIRDRLVGTMELFGGEPGAFDEDDKRLLETISPQAAIAIEKAQQVREREQELRNQIEELRIEIDHVKKERQVKAIAETDYFKHLKERAAELRRRAKRKSAQGENKG